MAARKKEQSAGAATDGNHGCSLISNEKLVHIYTSMVKCRMIEERVRALLGRNKSSGNGAAAGGREATAVGIAIDLLPADTVVAGHSDFPVNFIQGVPLDSILRTLFARAGLPSFAARLDVATSAALANKTKKNGKIVVAFSSGESGSLNSWNEALAKACVQRLPILFVAHGNSPAEPASLNAQSGFGGAVLKAQVCGLPEIAVDGNDVVAVYRVATEAIAHARRGNGPTLIECQVERSEAHDPIRKMEAYLEQKGLFRDDWKPQAAARFAMELDAAIEAAEAYASPKGVEDSASASNP